MHSSQRCNIEDIREVIIFGEPILTSRFATSHRRPFSTEGHLSQPSLSRHLPVFERYGPQLRSNELYEFDVLKSDYEINWHLKRLWSMSPTSEELRIRSVTVKNRRRAYLDKLLCDGNYFLEDAMRERELLHEYVGRFQDQSGRGMARLGERWSETSTRRPEEAFLVAKRYNLLSKNKF